MLNNITLRARVHAALTSIEPAALDLAAIRTRAAINTSTTTQQPRRRIAAITLAIAIPAVAFAATPQVGIQATMARLAQLYFGPTEAARIAAASATLPTSKIIDQTYGKTTRSTVFIGGKRVDELPLAQAVERASRDFNVVIPRKLPDGAKAGTATYTFGTLMYAYALPGGDTITVSIEKTSHKRLNATHKLFGLTANFSPSGRLLKSARMNFVEYVVGDEIVTLGSTTMSVPQLSAIGVSMGGRKLVTST